MTCLTYAEYRRVLTPLISSSGGGTAPAWVAVWLRDHLYQPSKKTCEKVSVRVSPVGYVIYYPDQELVAYASVLYRDRYPESRIICNGLVLQINNYTFISATENDIYAHGNLAMKPDPHLPTHAYIAPPTYCTE